jgi:hypothetical protein
MICTQLTVLLGNEQGLSKQMGMNVVMRDQDRGDADVLLSYIRDDLKAMRDEFRNEFKAVREEVSKVKETLTHHSADDAINFTDLKARLAAEKETKKGSFDKAMQWGALLMSLVTAWALFGHHIRM